MQLDLEGRSFDLHTIDLIRQNTPKDEPYYLAYSGGKDSDALLDLTKRAGVDFDAHYCFVPIDPPELRRHVYAKAKDPANHLTITMPKLSLIAAARKHGVMPIRRRRWCCEIFKEYGGLNRTVLTGVRWEESAQRKRRRMLESCARSKQFFVHPIIHWKTTDVWAYLRERGVPYCPLYDEGWKRLGCVLCPMADDVKRQIARWPSIARVWRRISDAAFAVNTKNPFQSPEAQWRWWLARGAQRKDDDDCPLFDGTLE